MPDGPSDDAPQIRDDMRFQRRTWIVQRAGWAAMGLLLLAALVGTFAKGPLSSAQARDVAGLVLVEYERFQRTVAPATLQLHLSREATSGDTVSVWMNRSLADALEIQRIEPEPQEERAAQGGIVFTFGIAEPGMPATIRFFTIVQKIGTVDGQIGVAGREPARFTQFVYP